MPRERERERERKREGEREREREREIFFHNRVFTESSNCTIVNAGEEAYEQQSN